MLRNMRKAGQTVVGKIIATIFFGAIIVSFAIWGIGDIFRATPASTVAEVGSTTISVEQVREAYTEELQRLGRQFRTVISPEQARAFGLDQQVINNLVTEAVMAEKAKEMGLSVSDELVAGSIVNNPAFKGADGQFNRALFDQALRNVNLSEAGFVQEQRASMLRLHLAEALAGDVTVPMAAKEALHRYASERRSASYLLLTPELAGDIPAPTAEQLQSFFNERKSDFRAPEYRSVSVLALDAASLARPETISEADARQRYEQQKARYGTPERRTIQQITFPSQAEAEAAAAKIKGGTAFEALAAERNISPQDLELGTFTKAEMLDQAVAEAAFGLEQGAVSAPIAGRFGPVLVRVTQVQPEAVRPFEDVAADLRREIAVERAQGQIEKIHDEIEDLRAGAKPLADIAREKGLTLIQVPAVDANGLDKAGSPVNLPEKDAVVKAAFASDIGVDNEALRTATGYVWYDVTGIEPSREKTLDEVREQVGAQWRQDQVAQRLSERARGLAERLEKGEAVEAVAQEAGVSVKNAADLSRNAAKDDLAVEAVNRIFAVPVGKAGHAASGEGRAVFKVTAATVPPLVTTTQQAQNTETQLRNAYGDDLISQYIAQVRQELEVTINQQALRRATGSES
ncbi:SurA N-terminal domain-containing protein [Microvirga arsenatis]|uniref:Parvulin-like PPIase n=1 Tax=Microvirga arsenatis TaxID=2692265 RepID=A0ABW9YSN6_9HYPH|nr:SurA N-terminal domain-containing protein [Microvirga arsenatis]NBJ12471.1 peptidylprolyl isomerase [Microvirga arsenatis]NBJ23347.1 peptidylprolyl isomerase [Microvirga arsenatis]